MKLALTLFWLLVATALVVSLAASEDLAAKIGGLVIMFAGFGGLYVFTWFVTKGS